MNKKIILPTGAVEIFNDSNVIGKGIKYILGYATWYDTDIESIITDLINKPVPICVNFKNEEEFNS